MSLDPKLLSALALIFGAACRAPSPPSPRDLPVVQLLPKNKDGVQVLITVADFRASIARRRLQMTESANAASLPPELAHHVLNSMIEVELLRLEAARLRIRASTTAVTNEWTALKATYEPGELDRQLTANYLSIQDIRDSISTRLTAQIVLEREVYEGIEVDDSELRAAFDGLTEAEKLAQERVHATQIVLDSAEEAIRVHRALQRGADFAVMARSLSTGPEAARDGDLGWFAAGEMPSVFDQACLPLELGAISDVTPSPFGYHICKVLERTPPREKSFEEMKSRLAERLAAEKRRVARQRYLDTLLAQFDVVRHPDRMTLED